MVDTNILSASAPTKVDPQQALRDWLERNSDRLYLSVITIAEIEDGIDRSRRSGATTKANRLAEWLDTVMHLYVDRVLPIDVAIARRIGALMDQARGEGHAPGLADVAIAATALARGYTILTRNLRHFLPLGVRAIDPFDATLPEGEA